MLISLVSGLPAANPVQFDVKFLHRFSFNMNMFIKLLNHILSSFYTFGAPETHTHNHTHAHTQPHTHTHTRNSK